MEFAGVFLMMVAVRPWKGPIIPLVLNTFLTQPETLVNAAAVAQLTRQPTKKLHMGELIVSPLFSHFMKRQMSQLQVSREHTFVVWVPLCPNDLHLDL